MIGYSRMEESQRFVIMEVSHIYPPRPLRILLNSNDRIGSGTTAIGLRNGLPTIVVPFFGDQQYVLLYPSL